MNHFNIVFGGWNPSIDEGIVRPPVMQYKARDLTKFWDLSET